MNKSIILCLLSLIASASCPQNQMDYRSPEEKPNIVLIVADDLGAADLNIYGSKDLITPHLDNLAMQGVRFSQFYVNSSVCSPSRTALLTGKYPQNAGLSGNASSDGSRGLATDQAVMAETFKNEGYRTAVFGKWHLGSSLEFGPNNQGFDEFFGCRQGVIDYYSHFYHWGNPIHPRHDLWRNEEHEYRYGENFSDLTVEESIHFIEENKNQPFFLYIPFGHVHSPIQPEREYVEMYKDIEDEKRRNYAAFVTSFDDKVGKIIEKLDALNLKENTIIVFLSDNGHDPGPWDWGGSAGPYKGAKSTFWEGGIRMPCFISWEGFIPKGEVRNQLVMGMDWMPTLLDYANIPFPDNNNFDGKSIKKIISDNSAHEVHQEVFWQLNTKWAVRKGSWKLVKHDSEELFLSNLDQDIGESVNLSEQNPEIRDNLEKLYNEWFLSTKQNKKEKSNINNPPEIKVISPKDGENNIQIHKTPENAWFRSHKTPYPFGRITNQIVCGTYYNQISDPAVVGRLDNGNFYLFVDGQKNKDNKRTYELLQYISCDGYNWNPNCDVNPMLEGVAPTDAIYHNGEIHLTYVDVTKKGNPATYTRSQDPNKFQNHYTQFVSVDSPETRVNETGLAIHNGEYIVLYEFNEAVGSPYTGFARSKISFVEGLKKNIWTGLPFNSSWSERIILGRRYR